MTMRWLYTVLLYLLTPLILLRLLWRSLQLADYRRRWGERFGHVRIAQPVAVWLHAVSVGESLAALPLIRALVDRHGPGRVLVTTTTPTGSARVRESLGDTVQHVYAPYDLPHVVARFLGRAQPQRVIVMETELWPNLFQALRRRGIPLFVVNARLSPGSFRGYGRVAGFTRDTLACCTAVLAQSDADADRFRQLGAAEVIDAGNIKFDQAVPAEQVDAGDALRERLGRERFTWAAVSTHEGEESLALDVHRALRETVPEAVLILVPRHPQRFDGVARTIQRSGLSHARRSEPATGDLASCAVLLGDSMGEMFSYLAAADGVFVGGSLVPVGGHNVLEPAAIGRPVAFGPQMFNFESARELLLDGAGAVEVTAADELVALLQAWARDPDARRRAGEAAREAVAANRGALARILDRVGG